MTPQPVRRLVGCSLALLLTACGSTSAPTEEAGAVSDVGTWVRGAEVPLSPRTDPVVAWTGTEVLVLGGNTGWICPPNADCMAPTALVADGAAWDPRTGTWRNVADAPVDLLAGWYCQPCAATVGGRVIVDASDQSGPRWLAYDPATDAWQRLETPDARIDLSQHDDTRIWGFRGTEIVSWEPISGDVRVERAYDETPRLDDPRLVLTDVGPVVSGVRYDDAAPDEPTLTQLDLPDGNGWRRVTTGQIGWMYAWVAGRVVGPESGGADGGEVDGWDHWYPQGGMVDPVTGEWSSLDVPDWTGISTDGWNPQVFGDDEIVTGGHFRDLGAGGPWSRMGRPDTGLDSHLSAVWASDRLVVLGGADDDQGYDRPADPELWSWVPPA
jgi:hypothetical protein